MYYCVLLSWFSGHSNDLKSENFIWRVKTHREACIVDLGAVEYPRTIQHRSRADW